MSGVAIIGALLVGSDAYLAIVPADRTAAGALPVGVDLPATVVKKVSGADDQQLAELGPCRQRVQVSVRTPDYVTKDRLIPIVKACCAGFTGEIETEVGTFTGVAVLSAGEGPDFDDGEAGIYQGSHDFLVTFTPAA